MMALRGGAHVVGHAAEKGLLGRLILAGDLQGVLQQLALSELLLFLIHFPQGENHFFRRKGFVIEDAGVDLHVPPGHPQQSQEEDRDDGNKEQAQPVEAAQDVRIGDRDNRDPAVIHPGVGNGPKVSVLICDGVGIIVQFPRIDLLDDGVEVVLHIFLRLRHVGLLVDDGACAVAQEKGILIELLGRIELEMKIFRENIEGQNGVPVSALLSRRDDRLVVDGVRVDVGENHLASGLARFLIPFRGGDIIGVSPSQGLAARIFPSRTR